MSGVVFANHKANFGGGSAGMEIPGNGEGPRFRKAKLTIENTRNGPSRSPYHAYMCISSQVEAELLLSLQSL